MLGLRNRTVPELDIRGNRILMVKSRTHIRGLVLLTIVL